MIINKKDIKYWGNKNAESVFIQIVDESDLGKIESQIDHLNKLTSKDFCLITILVDKWQDNLSPWKMEPIFKNEAFSGGANITKNMLETLMHNLKVENKKYYLLGYSLAGLFSLWMGYRTNLFDGIGAVSPSLWFDGWTTFIEENKIQTPRVYLSLGDKENKSKNEKISKIKDIIYIQEENLKNIDCILEFNEGNHFKDSDLRLAKAMTWLLEG